MSIILFILLGWPSAIVALTLLTFGVIRKNPTMSVIGAVISIGFCYYFSTFSHPYNWLVLISLIGINFLSAFAVWKRAYVLGAVLIAPFLVVVIYVAQSVLSQ